MIIRPREGEGVRSESRGSGKRGTGPAKGTGEENIWLHHFKEA